MEQKPLPLTGGEEAEYLLALKQEFRGAMKSLPCFIQPAAAHRGPHTLTHTLMLMNHAESADPGPEDGRLTQIELRIIEVIKLDYVTWS